MPCKHRNVAMFCEELPKTWREFFQRIQPVKYRWFCSDCGREVVPVYTEKEG